MTNLLLSSLVLLHTAVAAAPLGGRSLGAAGCGGTDLKTICSRFDTLQGDVQSCAFECIISGTGCMEGCVEKLGFNKTCADCWVSLASCTKKS